MILHMHSLDDSNQNRHQLDQLNCVHFRRAVGVNTEKKRFSVRHNIIASKNILSFDFICHTRVK